MKIIIHDHAMTLTSKHGLSCYFEINNIPVHTNIDFADVISLEFEAGNIDDYDTEGEGMVLLDGGAFDYMNSRGEYVETKAKRLKFTFAQYLRELGEDMERMLNDYIRLNADSFLETWTAQAA